MPKNVVKRKSVLFIFLLFLSIASLLLPGGTYTYAGSSVKVSAQVKGKAKKKKKKKKTVKKGKKKTVKKTKKTKKTKKNKTKKVVKKTKIKKGKKNGKTTDENVLPLFGDGREETFTINGKQVCGHLDAQKSMELIKMLNDYRAKHGRKRLKTTKELTRAAIIRSREITVVFDHKRPDGSICFTASKAMDGENIAEGFEDAKATMDGWSHSPGHNANMLNSSFKEIGISVFALKSPECDYYIYFAVQNFGR